MKKALRLTTTTAFMAAVLFSGRSYADWIQVDCPKDIDGKNAAVFKFASYDGELYVATDVGIWKSSDYGRRWQSVGLSESDDNPFTDILVHEGKIYAAGKDVYRYSGTGTAWERIGGDINGRCNNPLITLAVLDNDLYANIPQCEEAGIYKLTALSGSWARIAAHAKQVIWSDGGRLYAERKYFADGSWENLSGVSGTGAVYAYARTANKYYIGAYGAAGSRPVYRSDDGITFSAFATGIYRHAAAQAFETRGDTAFTLTEGINYLDDGETFVSMTTDNSNQWEHFGDAFHLNHDRADLHIHNDLSLFLGVNGKKLVLNPDGSIERLGGFGIFRYDFGEVTEVSAPKTASNSSINAIFDHSAGRISIGAASGTNIAVTLYGLNGRQYAAFEKSTRSDAPLHIYPARYIRAFGVYICRMSARGESENMLFAIGDSR